MLATYFSLCWLCALFFRSQDSGEHDASVPRSQAAATSRSSVRAHNSSGETALTCNMLACLRWFTLFAANSANAHACPRRRSGTKLRRESPWHRKGKKTPLSSSLTVILCSQQHTHLTTTPSFVTPLVYRFRGTAAVDEDELEEKVFLTQFSSHRGRSRVYPLHAQIWFRFFDPECGM